MLHPPGSRRSASWGHNEYGVLVVLQQRDSLLFVGRGGGRQTSDGLLHWAPAFPQREEGKRMMKRGHASHKGGLAPLTSDRRHCRDLQQQLVLCSQWWRGSRALPAGMSAPILGVLWLLGLPEKRRGASLTALKPQGNPTFELENTGEHIFSNEQSALSLRRWLITVIQTSQYRELTFSIPQSSSVIKMLRSLASPWVGS